jgi:protein gp37
MEEDDYFPHVHLGVSVEDQATADERIPLLLQTPAAKRFVSIEPMLGPVDLRQSTHKNLSHRQRAGGLSYSQATRLDGVILGGETGPGARPMHPDWPRKVRDDCKAAGVPFFFKQWGAWWNGLHWSQQRLKSKLKWGTIAKNGTFYPRMTPMAVSRKYGHDADWWCKGLVYRVGKKAAGRILDGREYREVTE